MLVERLNELSDNKYDYSLEYAYGGVLLAAKGGSVSITHRTSKKEQYYLIVAYIHGMEVGKGGRV